MTSPGPPTPGRRLHTVLVGPASPYRGGIAHFTNRLAVALAGAGEVELLSFSSLYPGWLFPGKTQYEASRPELPAEPVRLLSTTDPRSWRRAAEWIAGREPDVIVLAYWMPFVAPAYLGLLRALRARLRRLGRPAPRVVLWLHNLLPHEPLPLARPLVRRLVGACDAFVSLSEKVAAELLALRPGAQLLRGFHPAYDIFPPPLPPAEARRLLGLPERPTLLFFGLVRRYKGLDVLLEALPRVRAERDVQLVVAGEFYEKEETYRAQVARLGLEGTVHFHAEYVPNDRVHLYFSAADAVVQPYRSATQSGVVQTAFYFGTPVIVTAVGGLAEAVAGAGLVAPPGDPEALARTILSFYAGDRAALAEGARRLAALHSWDRLAGLFHEFAAGL